MDLNQFVLQFVNSGNQYLQNNAEEFENFKTEIRSDVERMVHAMGQLSPEAEHAVVEFFNKLGQSTPPQPQDNSQEDSEDSLSPA